MKILADASLPGLNDFFPAPFVLTLYKNSDELSEKLNDKDILICRSTLKVNESLLKNASLQYLATASSGTDHIDKAWLKKQGIQLIDAKGSNARSVADYVMASLASLQLRKGFQGKKAIVVGLGMVGSQVLARLNAVGLQVSHYDPLKALKEPGFSSCDLNELSRADLICIHAELHDEPPCASRNLFGESLINQLKEKVVIINASRGDIVNEAALLANKKSIIYCTDVFSNEPRIARQIIDYATLCTPHIAGHSIEAKIEAIRMISHALHKGYGLTAPEALNSKKTSQPLLPQTEHWQGNLLSLYDPAIETSVLKSAEDLEQAFIELRKAHNWRHDFNIQV